MKNVVQYSTEPDYTTFFTSTQGLQAEYFYYASLYEALYETLCFEKYFLSNTISTVSKLK